MIVHHIHRLTVHVIRGELSVQLEQLQLLEAQDLALVRADYLLASSIWSIKLDCPLAD